MVRLSVIIVNWNVGEYLWNCLASLEGGLGGMAPKSEIIVIDNASRDLPSQAIQDQYPQVKLILNRSNLGFARACNQGIRASGGKWILLLNPDCELGGGAAERLIEFAEEDFKVGAVGPMLVDDVGRYQCSHSCEPTPFSELRRMLHLDFAGLKCRPVAPKRRLRVDVLQGACLLLSRDALEEVGLFDEAFFMYSEEVDLCRRLKLNGWEVFWLPEAKAVHHGAVSTNLARHDMFLHLYRSKVIYFRKHYGTTKGRIYKLILFFTSSFRLLLFPISLFQSASKRRESWVLACQYGSLLRSLPSF